MFTKTICPRQAGRKALFLGVDGSQLYRGSDVRRDLRQCGLVVLTCQQRICKVARTRGERRRYRFSNSYTTGSSAQALKPHSSKVEAMFAAVRPITSQTATCA